MREDHEFISKEYYLHWCEGGNRKLMLKVDNMIPLWRFVILNMVSESYP